jgi:hypothetical protein
MFPVAIGWNMRPARSVANRHECHQQFFPQHLRLLNRTLLKILPFENLEFAKLLFRKLFQFRTISVN